MIEDIIRENAEALTTAEFTFYDSELYEANEKADDIDSPFVLLVHPIKGRDEILPAGNQATTYPLTIMFAIVSKLTDKQATRQGNINLMLAAKNEFVTRLQNDSRIEKIISSEFDEFQNEFDRNLDGIMLFISPKVYPAENICAP